MDNLKAIELQNSQQTQNTQPQPQSQLQTKPQSQNTGPEQSTQASLQSQTLPQPSQLSYTAQKSEEVAKAAKTVKAARFKSFAIPTALYALFYTFCLYHNASGITYPFFAGGTLWFFSRCIRESKSSSAAASATFNKYFLAASILAAGALNCCTDSGVLLFFNKTLMYTLLIISFLEMLHDTHDWSITANVRAIFAVIFGAIGKCFDAVSDACAAISFSPIKDRTHNKEQRRIIISIIIGVIISIPISFFVLLLLGDADAIFWKLLSDTASWAFEHSFEINKTVAKLIARIVITFAISYGLLSFCTDSRRIKAIDEKAARQKPQFDEYIAITFTAIVAVIYLIFSFTQIFGLFLGKMALPEGFTYSSYARKGFFDLVILCVFNIVLVLCTTAYFKTNKILRSILTVICLCTYIMAASSAFRMFMYIKEYNLTFLRLLVLWGLLMTAVVMAEVITYVYRSKLRLFKYITMTLTIGWLAFSALHPDYWIMRYNVAKADYTLFYHYSGMSLDAFSAAENIDNLNEMRIMRRIDEYADTKKGIDAVRKFNFSKEYALYKANSMRYESN